MLADGIKCGSPLFTTGMHNGLVCYTGTTVGSTAVHHCFNCGYDPTVSTHLVRTCQPNGTWNGTVPYCGCSKESIAITINSIFSSDYYQPIIINNR